MDHLEVLREKIGRLREEIAQIQELNKQHQLQGRDGAEAQVAHVQRQERLLDSKSLCRSIVAGQFRLGYDYSASNGTLRGVNDVADWSLVK